MLIDFYLDKFTIIVGKRNNWFLLLLLLLFHIQILVFRRLRINTTATTKSFIGMTVTNTVSQKLFRTTDYRWASCV